MEELLKKVWYVYTLEYYSAEKNDILNFACKWMEIENAILNNLNEITQTQKDGYGMYLLISGF